MTTPTRETSKSGIDPELLDGVLVQAETVDGSPTINRLMVPRFMDLGSKGSNIETPATN